MSQMEAAVRSDLSRAAEVVNVRQQDQITQVTNPVGANMSYSQTQESQKLDLKRYKQDYIKSVGAVLTSSQPAVDAHIKTDKLVYKPGDRMYIEVYIFDSFYKLPLTQVIQQYYPSGVEAEFYYPYYSSYLYATLQVLDQLDQSVYTTGSSSENSTISFTYDIPSDQTGGEYKLVVTSGSGRFADAIRLIRIRQYEEQQLVIQADFDKDSYKPGDTVEVSLRVSTQDGSQFAVLPSYTYTIDFSANNASNKSVMLVQNMTQTFLDSQGTSTFTFVVPADTTRNEATLFVNVRYQATLVPFSRTLSLVQPDNIVIDFFPETNNYVLGVPNKVYYQAYSNNERVNTIDLSDSMLLSQDASSNDLVTLSSNLSTLHLGRGYFEFVPELNKEYFFLQSGQLDSSQNASFLKRHSLNVSSQVGLSEFEISFSLTRNVLANDEDLEIRLFTNQFMNPNDVYVLGVYNLEKAMYLAQLQFEANKSYIHNVKWQDFNLTNGGVLRVQVFRVLRPLIWYERFEQLSQGLQPNRFMYNSTLDIAPAAGSDLSGRDNTTQDQARKNISIRTQLENPLYEYYSIPLGEILFFKKPDSLLDIQITTDKDTYMPGDMVQFEVRVTQGQIGGVLQDSTMFFNTSIVGNETTQQSNSGGYYVSSVVSDDSVYRLVPQRQQPPSLPTMVLLERELYLTNFDFLNNDQYVDYLYPQANDSATQPPSEPSDKKLDLLLGVQGWRKGFFYPQVLEELQLVAKNQSYEDRYLMQRALAFKFQEFQPYQPYAYNYYGSGGSATSAAGSGTGSAAAPRESMNLSTASGVGAGMATPQPPAPPGQLGAPLLVTGGAATTDENIGASQLTLTQKEQALWEFIKSNRQCQAIPNTRYYANAQRLSFLSDIGGRYDMTDTVFYSTANYTKSGVFRGSFFLSDLVTQFRISANAFDNLGRLGFGSKLITSQKPFYINIQLPQMLVIGDRLQIQLQAFNNLDQTLQARFSIMDYDDIALLVTMTQENDLVTLPPLGSSENLTQANQLPILTIEAQNFTQPLADAQQSQQQAIDDQAFIQIRGVANTVQGGQQRRFQDALLKQLRVVSPGVPQLQEKGGLISNAPESQSVATFTFTVPETVVLGTLELVVEVYPANYQALLEALRRIILQPIVCTYCYGPTTYAKALAVEAATASGGALAGQIDSGIITKAREDITKEYQDLSRDVHDDGSYSVSSEGKPDLIATVQDLQIIDAVGNANVGIDKASRDKTVQWVLSQRDAQGHFIIVPPIYNPQPQYLVDAYIVWILSDIGVEQSEVQSTLNSLNDVATQQMSQGVDADLYFLGLQSATYYNFNQTDVAQRYADFLATQQGDDGALHQVTTFFSTEANRQNGYSEATAIATIAWENNFDRYAENIAKAVDYLVDSSYFGYYYYPTHSTILSLRAILGYLKTVSPIEGEGDFILLLDNSTTLVSQQPFSFNDSTSSISYGSDYYSYYDYYGYYPQNVMKTISFDTSAFISALTPGSNHTLTLSVENYIPRNASSDNFTSQYSMSFAYDDTQPVEKANRTSLGFTVTRSNRSGTNASQGAESQIGDIATYNIVVSSLQSKNGAGVGLVIVKFRPPSCYQMNFDLFETIRRNGVISMYEFKQSNTEVWMYIEGILPGQSTQIVIELAQIFNGICQERPQEAVEYYNPQEPLYAFP